MGIYFPAHGFKFYLELFVFGYFVAEEAGGEAGFGLQAGWGQDVGIAGFIGVLFEVAGVVEEVARAAFTAAHHKLPLRTRLISREPIL